MTDVVLRAVSPADLDFILSLEHRPENRIYIGRWSREEHLASLAMPDRRHLLIESGDRTPLGYLVAYDRIDAGFGIYVKRIAVATPAQGTGRAALTSFLEGPWTAAAPFVCLAVRSYNERAQRIYRAAGFGEWPVDDGKRARFLERVDPAAGDCLLMRTRLSTAG